MTTHSSQFTSSRTGLSPLHLFLANVRSSLPFTFHDIALLVCSVAMLRPWPLSWCEPSDRAWAEWMPSVRLCVESRFLPWNSVQATRADLCLFLRHRSLCAFLAEAMVTACLCALTRLTHSPLLSVAPADKSNTFALSVTYRSCHLTISLASQHPSIELNLRKIMSR